MESSGVQDLQAAPEDPVHPHEVHDVQTDAGDDPGTSGSRWESVERLGTNHATHLTVIQRDDHDPDQEERECHGYSVNQAWSGDLVVTKGLKEPPETHHVVTFIHL